jgi:hypothetical protein
LELNQLIQEVKNKKGWEVKLITSTTSSPQSYFNVPLATATATKTIVFIIPQSYPRQAEIFISNDLKGEISNEVINGIKTNTIQPQLKRVHNKFTV